MNKAVCLIVFGLWVVHAQLEGFTPIFSVADESSKTLASIAVDEDSNIALMGSFIGTFEIGEKHFSSSSQDVFIAKLNSDHSIAWSHQFGGESPDDPGVIKFDHSNDIIFGAKFASHSITFQNKTILKTKTDPLNFLFDIVIGKIKSNGSLSWMINFGDVNESASQHLTDIEITKDNSLVVCGVYHAVGYFGGDRFYARSHKKARFPLSDIFVAKYTPNGDHLWSIGLGGEKDESTSGLALDSDDNAFVAATFGSEDFVLNGTLLPEPRGRDCLVMKFTPDGKYAWHKQFGSRGTDALKAIAVDSQDNIILAGEVGGNITIDDVNITASGFHNLFLIKLSKTGDYLWGHTFSADFIMPKQALINFRTDQIFVLGNYNSGSFSLGLSTLPSSSDDCLFVGEWTKNGEVVASKGLCGNQLAHTQTGAVDQRRGHLLIATDLYDLSNLGTSADDTKTAIAVWKQIVPTVSRQIRDEL